MSHSYSESRHRSPSPTQLSNTISLEILLAIRRYKQELAAYTLTQWNVARSEAETKDKDRRRRRAELLASRNQAGISASVGRHGPGHQGTWAVNGSGSTYGGSGSNSANSSSKNGPLMMTTRRRTERVFTTSTYQPQTGYRLHPEQTYDRPSSRNSYPSGNNPSYMPDEGSGRQQHHHSPPQLAYAKEGRRHSRSIHHFDHPHAAYIEHSSAIDDSDELCTPSTETARRPARPRARPSRTTPPIDIPQPRHEQPPNARTASFLASGSGGDDGTLARALLGRGASLGMTSIASSSSSSVSASTSESMGGASEGSSGVSSWSDRDTATAAVLKSRPTSGRETMQRSHTNAENRGMPLASGYRPLVAGRVSITHLDSEAARRQDVDVAAAQSMDGAIWSLRRMTVSGGELMKGYGQG